CPTTYRTKATCDWSAYKWSRRIRSNRAKSFCYLCLGFLRSRHRHFRGFRWTELSDVSNRPVVALALQVEITGRTTRALDMVRFRRTQESSGNDNLVMRHATPFRTCK